MAVGNAIRYRWRSEFQEVTLKDKVATVLFKQDDGGALYRKGLAFSLDLEEVRARAEEKIFDGYLLKIKDNNNCNYSGYYFINKKDFNNNKIIVTNNSFRKYHIPIKAWTKLELKNDIHFIKSNDIQWHLRLASDMRAGKLSGLKDDSDIRRYKTELAIGVY